VAGTSAARDLPPDPSLWPHLPPRSETAEPASRGLTLLRDLLEKCN
jgi:hypothetical protein